MNLSIQKAVLSNAAALTALLNETVADLHRRGIRQWESPWDSEEICREIGQGRVWAAWGGGTLAGTFSLKPLESAGWLPDSAKPGGQWYLYRVEMHPSRQGKGEGRTLVQFACQLAKAAKKDLYLDCWAGNDALRRFYTSAGFDTIGIFPEENYKISVFMRSHVRS